MNQDMLAQLNALRERPKFVAEPGTLYNGLRPEEVRQVAEHKLNDLIERLISGAGDPPAKDFVLAQFAETLDRFPGSDTEDRERMCDYLSEIMDILVIESSDGLLNRWMYGGSLSDLLTQQGNKSN